MNETELILHFADSANLKKVIKIILNFFCAIPNEIFFLYSEV